MVCQMVILLPWSGGYVASFFLVLAVFRYSSSPILQWAVAFIFVLYRQVTYFILTCSKVYFWTCNSASPRWRNVLCWIVGCEFVLPCAGWMRICISHCPRRRKHHSRLS
ncbi:hypothetical protein J3A83DRAFT_4225640, partial [Scleroderma citrinum]